MGGTSGEVPHRQDTSTLVDPHTNNIVSILRPIELLACYIKEDVRCSFRFLENIILVVDKYYF
jgi:hypothetical protein